MRNKKSKNSIQTKRRPAKRSGFKFLHAKTSRKKSNRKRTLKASVAASDGELGSEVPRLGVTGALLIILALHILIIAAILFNAKTTSSGSKATASDGSESFGTGNGDGPSYLTVESDLSSLEENTPYHYVQMGDTYARIAQKHGVDESELRRRNKNEALKSGKILSLPPRRVVAMNDPEIERLKLNSRKGRDTALVKPRIQYQQVREVPLNREHLYPVVNDQAAEAPRINQPSQRPQANRRHVVRSGDSIWRISRNYNVSQASLLRANNNLDPRKLRVGMKLVIPSR